MVRIRIEDSLSEGIHPGWSQEGIGNVMRILECVSSSLSRKGSRFSPAEVKDRTLILFGI